MPSNISIKYLSGFTPVFQTTLTKARLRGLILNEVDWVTPSEKLLLLIIVEHYNSKKGYAWPSVERMAHQCCLSNRNGNHRQVRRLIQSLEEKDILVRLFRTRRNGSQMSNGYAFAKSFIETLEGMDT